MKSLSNLVSYIKSVNRVFSWRYIFLRSSIIGILIHLLGTSDFVEKLNQINPVYFATFVLICIVVIGVLIKMRIDSLLRCKFINQLDCTVILIICGYSLYIAIKFMTIFFIDNNATFMTLYDGMVLEFVLMWLLVIQERIAILDSHQQTEVNDRGYSLVDLYYDNIPQEVKEIFLEDRDVDLDLLGRDNIINSIYHTITEYPLHSHTTIAIKGPWGSGKTTLIKNVKKKIERSENPNTIVIDDFEPWKFGDNSEDEIWVRLFDAIMRKISQESFSIANSAKMIDDSASLIQNILGIVLPKFRTANAVQIKRIISDFIAKNNKKIILVIDNLERCSSANIATLLKATNLININGVDFVLLYDEQAMRARMKELGLEYCYLEKIVQIEFNVPAINKNRTKSLVERCVENYISHMHFNMTSKQLRNVNEALRNHIKSPRDLIRIINSVFSASLGASTELDKIDLLCIELIHLQNPALWQEIRSHMKYFVSVNDGIPSFQKGFSEEDETRKNKYIESFLGDPEGRLQVSSYRDLLELIFPHFKVHSTPLLGDGRAHIRNGLYFDTFFDRDRNLIKIAEDKAKKFIDNIENGDLTADNAVKWYIDNVESEEWIVGFREFYIMQRINCTIKKLSVDKIHTACDVLCRLYWHVDTSISLQENILDSARRMVPLIIFTMLCVVPDERAIVAELKCITEQYDSLSLMMQMKEYAESYAAQHPTNAPVCCDLITDAAESMLADIVKKKINPYSKDNYHRQNAMPLYMNKNTHEYIKDIVSFLTPSAPLVIADYIELYENSEDEFVYKINESALQNIFQIEDVMAEILKVNHGWPESDLVKIIKKIAKSHIDGVPVYADGFQGESPFLHHAGEYISQYRLNLDNLVDEYISLA